jgi:biotin synthase-like enzyme
MSTAQADLFYRFGAALVIGLLIGMERKRAAEVRDLKLLLEEFLDSCSIPICSFIHGKTTPPANWRTPATP